MANRDLHHHTSTLLREAGSGSAEAVNRLIPLVYDELRCLASDYLRRERAGHTLQATALVNDAFIRLLGGQPVDVQGRTHFKAIAARSMKQVLIDHARSRDAAKRGGGRCRIVLEEVAGLLQTRGTELTELVDALEGLETEAPRVAQVVDLRFFGGMTNAEVAECLGLSVSTVEADWRVARAWLRRALSEGTSDRFPRSSGALDP